MRSVLTPNPADLGRTGAARRRFRAKLKAIDRKTRGKRWQVPQLSIVIPAYNESARIEQTLERVMSCVEKQGWDAEVLVVDDGSKDATPEIVHRWMERYPRLHLIKNEGNRGKGYSVRNGLLQAAGEMVMFTDADLSAPMEEAERLFAALADGADVAIGSRWMDEGAGRRFISRCTAGSSGGASTG